ncbi:MAG: glycosyltransferase [Bacteroidales bacterium]|nr:glycosyltransferase [Bacteroidales bacterium]
MAPCFGTVARIAGKQGTKVICIFDNVIPHEKKVFDRMLTRYFVRSIDAAIVMSKSVGEDLEQFRTDIPVVYNPHPLFDNYGDIIPRGDALGKLGLPEDCSYLLFFGFIREYKGLDILLKAFGDRRLRDMKLRLLVAGEFYENDQPYKKLVRDAGIEDDVIFFDRFIGEDEVSIFFSAADLVVQPYRSATQSGVTQIAYHFGKPMLVTDVGGLSEIVADGKCGYVVKPEPGEVAEAIIDYFSNKRQSQFTEGVEKEKSRFTWDRLTDSILKVYKVISGK